MITYFLSFIRKNLNVQPLTMLFSRSCTKLNTWIFDPPNLYGIPRYNPIPHMFWIPKMSRSSCLADSSILTPNWIEDFWKIIIWPVTASYSFKILRMVRNSFLFALQKRLSSVNSIWDIDGHGLAAFIPVNCFSLSAFLIFVIRYSILMMNRYGESGLPWRKPL